MSSEKELTIEALLHERENLIRERDEARAKADTYERDWYEAKSEFGTATAKLRERMRVLKAEVERLRGVGGSLRDEALLWLDGPATTNGDATLRDAIVLWEKATE